jgi:hypothetical protein
MDNLEKNSIKVVARLSPWPAPLPSAYFVARSAMVHLDLPLSVAVLWQPISRLWVWPVLAE